jgi:hypothetical protein
VTNSDKKPDSFTHENFDQVLSEEKRYLTSGSDEPLSGIAFSGGGIRSASFGLGVMQAMVKHRKLEKMHYMSTVSGGGYLGTALTWALHQEKENAGTSPENFPLGHKDAQGNKRDNPERNKRLDYIRLHSNYLTPDKLGLLSVASVAVRSIFMSLLVYMLLFVSIMGVLVAVSAFDTRYFGELLGIGPESFGGAGIFVPLALLLTGIYLLLNLYYSLYTKLGSKRSPETKYLYFIKTQRLAGLLWKVILLFLLFGLIPFIQLKIKDLQNGGGSLMLAGGSTSFGILVSIWQYWKAQKHDKSSGAVSGTMVYLGAFSLIYGLTFIAYLLGQKGIAFGHSVSSSEVRFFWPAIFSGSLLLLSFFFGVFVNLNLISPSRIWRNRLMETFMPEPDAVKENKWQPAISADKTLLEDMCQGTNKKPYHLINTNLILANSEMVKFRSRGGDNFVLSPLYCGSSATGWCKTDKTHRHFSRRVSLATAMATSAAAVNPNAGVSGEGATRNTIVSVMFIILNIRLGFWMTNPNKKPWKMPPNFFVPGLNGQLFGWGLKETNRNIQLSDGGHFENLGIYELIRRELSVIMVSDGGADPLFNFDDLANAVEKVRVDFGAQIEFKKEYPLSDLLPETETDSANKIFIAKYALAQRGFAVADIHYASGKKGTLYYLKLTMVRNLPTDVYSYKGVHPEFPHQSTADQFFDEKQFEAYRELGYKIGCDLFDTKHQETSLVNI